MASSSIRSAGAALAAALTLAACSGAPPATSSSAPFLLSSSVDRSGAAQGGGVVRPDRGRPWMHVLSQTRCPKRQVLPPCGLLYVSDYYDDDVVVYQNDQVVGTLTGLHGPDG